VKELLHKDKIEFLKEKTILVALGAEPHPHLIQLLGTYRKLRSYHLIFPCADANLRVYWSNNPAPQFTRDRVLWSVKQMIGISDGLNRIHGFKVVYDLKVEPHLYTQVSGRKYKLKAGEEKFGRHGDIKAENLLWFKDENVLKITDFGLGRFHGRYSRSRIDPRNVISPLTYEPPECTIGRLVSRRYDIWSMGCLFLEFITWLLAGNEKLDEFSEERGKFSPDSEVNDDNFFTAFGDDREPEVRNSVVQWVKDLHAHEKCSGLIHDLLDLVMGHMLRVDPDERIEAADLKERMKEMVSKAEANDEYLIRPYPRS
jgi:serine/threonine protein kinase